MVRYSDDVLEAVRRSVDVAEVVGRFVPLKRAGRSWKGCCPFHQEKTPSFHVHPESGIWKCYGCGKGGNVFGFLIEREAITFPEAVRQLAREGGITLPDDDDPQAAERARRIERLREAAEWACRAFETGLRSPDGERAREYLKGRGITGVTAKAFRLGYALPGWDRLLTAARDEGIPEADLEAAGLIRQKDGGGFRDWFRDRVIFPIMDAQGRPIAFGARTLGDDEPKYLNSPETPLFTKGKNLYALHLAKQEMMRAPHEGAVMEGYTDVILAHQAGFKVAVAGLGTALTAEQAKKLAQYVKKLFLVYDGDAAGMRAAEKAITAFLPEPIETRVCVLPGGKDPAEVIVEDGVEAFRAALAQSREAFEHLLSVRSKAHEASGIPGRAAAADECLAALAGVRDEVRRALYLKRLADAYAIPEEVLARKLRDLARSAPAPREQAPPPQPRRVAEGAPGYVADAPRSQQPAPAAPPAPELPPDTPPTPTERLILQALLARPELLREAPDDLASSLGSRLVRRLVARIAEEASRDAFDVARVVGSLEPDLAALAADLRRGGEPAPRPASAEAPDELVRQGRECMQMLVLGARLRAAEDRRRRAEADDDVTLLDQALRDIIALQVALQRMQPSRSKR